MLTATRVPGVHVQNFVAADEFCIRVCKDGPNAPALCQHIYDVMGCFWNMPGDYSSDSFDSCKGESGEVCASCAPLLPLSPYRGREAATKLYVHMQPMGVYGTSTWFQGQSPTPDAHPAPATSSCVPTSTIGNGLAASTTESSGASATGTGTGNTGSKSSAVRTVYIPGTVAGSTRFANGSLTHRLVFIYLDVRSDRLWLSFRLERGGIIDWWR